MTRIIQTVARPPFGEPVFAPDVVPAYRGGESLAWSPLDIPNIIDYGIRNLSNLYINRVGTGSHPANEGDLVGTWDGELGVYSFRASSGQEPNLTTDGVRFNGNGTKQLTNNANVNIPYNAPLTFVVIERLTIQDATSPISYTYSRANGSAMLGRNGYVDTHATHVRNGTGTQTPIYASYSGTKFSATVTDGTAAWRWADDAKVSITTGPLTDNLVRVNMYNTGVGIDSRVVAWCAIADAISDADWARVIEWGNTL